MQPRADRFGTRSPFRTLRQFAQPRPQPEVAELCELCSIPLAPHHRHLLEVEVRRIVCACDPCALRFHNVIGGRFKLIPRDARALPGFRMTDAQWDELALPINLAFFLHSSPAGKVVALYPSPAGVTESLLPLASWDLLVEENPALAEMEDDVEALLVNRVTEPHRYFLAPIDACYELAGLVRLRWRGLSGGDAVWREIDQFFIRLEQAARPLKALSHTTSSSPPPTHKDA